MNEISNKCEENLASVLGLARYFLKKLQFNSQKPQELYSVCLYCRLFELACGCKSLLESRTLVAIPILLRSMFEADIDLTNLINEKNYHKYMYATFLNQKKKVTKNTISDQDNPFLSAVRNNRIPQDDFNAIEKEIGQLKADGFTELKIFCRAKRAGKLDEYKSVYSLLCLDTHNNIQSLEECHIEKNDNNNYQVTAFKQTKEDLVHYLSSIPAIILHQTKSLAEFLGTKDIEFKKYDKESLDLQDMIKKAYS